MDAVSLDFVDERLGWSKVSRQYLEHSTVIVYLVKIASL